MDEIREVVESPFLNGEHAHTHESCVWDGVLSEQFGEQTYIRCGKSTGGPGGISLSPDQVSLSILAYYICNMLSLSMDRMFLDINVGDNYDATCGKDKHKEEGHNQP